MTMHLAPPSLTTTGKRKGIKKYKNSQAAKLARELDESWKNLQKKWVPIKLETKEQLNKIPTLNYRGKNNTKPPSIDSGHRGAVASKAIPQYTGTKIIGICQMAKSNAVPVSNPDHIVDIARMRRG